MFGCFTRNISVSNVNIFNVLFGLSNDSLRRINGGCGQQPEPATLCSSKLLGLFRCPKICAWKETVCLPLTLPGKLMLPTSMYIQYIQAVFTEKYLHWRSLADMFTIIPTWYGMAHLLLTQVMFLTHHTCKSGRETLWTGMTGGLSEPQDEHGSLASSEFLQAQDGC